MFEQPNQKRNTLEMVDISGVLFRNRILMGAIVGACVVFGVVISFVTQRVYMVDSLIEVGTFLGAEDASIPIERPRQLTEKITTGSYDSAIRSALGLDKDRVLPIKAINPDNTNLVHVFIHSTDLETDKNVLATMNTIILGEHKKRFDARGMLAGTVPTVIAKEPTIAVNPSNQKPLLTIVASFFVGLLIAVVFVFGREWWRKTSSSAL